MQHSPNGNAQAISPWSCLIPWQLVIQGKLPPLKISFPSTAPDPVEAAGEGNGSFHLLILGDENNVGHPQLRSQFAFSLHGSEQPCQLLDRRVWQVPEEMVRNAIRSCSLVGQTPKKLLQLVRLDGRQLLRLIFSCFLQEIPLTKKSWIRAWLPDAFPLSLSCLLSFS